MVAPRLIQALALDETSVLLTFDQPMLQDSSFFDTSNYDVSGHSVASLTTPTTSTARLTLGEGMLNGTDLTATVGDTLKNALLELMDPSFLSVVFIGLGTAPTISTVVSTGTYIRITFSEPMLNNSALSSTSSYSIGLLSPGAALAVVSNVVVEPVSNPNFADIYTNAKLTNGATYIASFNTNEIKDIAANVLDITDPLNNRQFTAVATLPKVSSADLLVDRVRINFDTPMLKSAALSSPANYLFTPITSGAANLHFDEVIVPDVSLPYFVEIKTTEMTNGADYEVAVNSSIGGPTDASFNNLNASFDVAAFQGVGENPVIDRVVSVSKNRVDVVFSEPMKSNLDIVDPTRYTWTGGLETISVIGVTSAGVVKLVTTDQIPGQLYTLTVDPT